MFTVFKTRFTQTCPYLLESFYRVHCICIQLIFTVFKTRFTYVHYLLEFIERIKAEGEKILKENDPRMTSRINPHSVFWMVAAMAVFYYTDFYIAVRFDSRIHR